MHSGADARARRAPGPRISIAHACILIVLMAMPIACGILTSVASSDTNRDIFFAESIASGTYFPLTGPAINAMLHLGPLWYYLLAVPVSIVHNAAAVTGFMAAIFALQFPLAYLIGRRFDGPRAGLLFAFALALPGWIDVPLASMTHTIAVVPSLLLGAAAALAYRARPTAGRAALVGLACVFMLTAHPTLVLFGAALVLWSAAATPSRAQWLPHGAIVLGLLLVALAPVGYQQWRDGFADAATAASYAGSEWHVPSLSEVGELLFAILWLGPKYIARFWLELEPRPMRLLLLVYGLLVAAAMAGLVRRWIARPEQRRLIAWLLALLLVQSVFVCAIRIAMPPWMVYAEWPLAAALIALGLDALCDRRAGAVPVAIGLAATTLWSAAVYARLAAAPLDHLEMQAPPGKYGFMDVRDYEKGAYRFTLARIPFRDLFAIGDPLCKPVALYGHYAYLVDYTYAVSALARCGETTTVQFGGMPEPGRTGLLGLHETAWDRLGMKPAQRIGALGLVAPAAVWQSPVALEPVLPRLANQPRKLDTAARKTRVSGDAQANEAVLVAHRAHRYLPFEFVAAHADGVPVVPAYADATTVVLRAPPGTDAAARVHWEIEFDAVPAYVDVLTFDSAP